MSSTIIIIIISGGGGGGLEEQNYLFGMGSDRRPFATAASSRWSSGADNRDGARRGLL